MMQKDFERDSRKQTHEMRFSNFNLIVQLLIVVLVGYCWSEDVCLRIWKGPWKRDFEIVKEKVLVKKERLESLRGVLDEIESVQVDSLLRFSRDREVSWEVAREMDELKRNAFSVVGLEEDLIIGFSGDKENILWFRGDEMGEVSVGEAWNGYSAGVYDGKLFVVGGYRDGQYFSNVWYFDLVNGEDGSFELGFSLADAAIVQVERNLYVYGGRNEDKVLDSLYRIDMKEKTVGLVSNSGTAVYSSGIGYSGCKFYVFGGQRDDSEFVNDFVKYQSEFESIEMSSNDLPLRRASFAMIIYDGYLMIYGGVNHDGVLSDLIRLDIRKPEQEYRFETVALSESVNVSRFGFGIYNRGLYLVGGLIDGEISGSMYRLDLWKVTDPRVTVTPVLH